jgi:hypothetical protein
MLHLGKPGGAEDQPIDESVPRDASCQNAAIGMVLLCPSDSVSHDAMDVGVVVDRIGFVSRSRILSDLGADHHPRMLRLGGLCSFWQIL